MKDSYIPNKFGEPWLKPTVCNFRMARGSHQIPAAPRCCMSNRYFLELFEDVTEIRFFHEFLF